LHQKNFNALLRAEILCDVEQSYSQPIMMNLMSRAATAVGTQPQRNVSAATGRFTRLTAAQLRAKQLEMGSEQGEVLIVPGTATATVNDTMTHIRLANFDDILVVTLPDPVPASEFAGATKIFVMDSPGNVTILSNGGTQSVRLSLQAQSAMFTWTGTEWVIMSSSQTGSVPNSFNFLSINDAYLEITAYINAGPDAGATASCAGFFVTADGYAATAAHCVLNDNADPTQGFCDLYVHVINYNGTGQHLDVWVSGSGGDIIGIDGSADVAVFRVPGVTNQAFLTWGDTRSLMFGETIYAIGNPKSRDFSSVSTGHVKDPKYWDIDMYNQDSLFMDIGLPGNSGGPVLNGQMQVVGISSWVYLLATDPVLGGVISATIDYATTTALDASYANGPPGTLSGSANNVPLVIDGHTFTVADIGTTFLVKDGTYNSVTPTQPSLNFQTNGTYIYTALQTVGTPWQATRTLPFTQANIAASGGYLYGSGPLVSVSGLIPTSVAISPAGNANANTTQTLINSVIQIDAPLQDNVIFQDSTILPLRLEFPESTLFGAASQHQAQPIIEAIIAGDRLSPAPNPVLNSISMYNQKGWFGGFFRPWTTERVFIFQAIWGGLPAASTEVYGAQLSFVVEGGIDYPIGVPPLGAPQYSPIEVAFDAAFGLPAGTLRQIVTGTWIAPNIIPLVVYSVDGQRIGTQDGYPSAGLDQEVPLAQVLWANPPGSTVDVIMVDPLGLLFGPPYTAVTFPLTLGTMPASLDVSLSRNTSNKISHPRKITKAVNKPQSSGSQVDISAVRASFAAASSSGRGARLVNINL
jgi:S1-C subfamily serine protease